MDEIEQQRKQLDDLHHLVNSLNIFISVMPPFLVETCLVSFLNDIKYLSGYLDCMLKFKINLPNRV